MRVFFASLGAAYLLAVALVASGCSGSNGWRVEFGVSPVNSLDNRAQFAKQAEAEAGNVRTTAGSRAY